MKQLGITALFILFVGNAFAQLNPNARKVSFTLLADTTQLDTMPIVRGTVISSMGTEGRDYLIDYANALFVSLSLPKGSVVDVRFSIMSLQLNKPIQRKSTDMIRPEFVEIKNPFLYTPNMENAELFSRDGLRMNGNISRGLVFGNNQDVVVNSNLNLQLAGKLGNDIDVLAVISDENNPIQPEGNTQQLQDFDRVFIQMSKDNNKVVVGDFEMIKPQHAYFLNYYKKSRGLQMETLQKMGKQSNLLVQADAAVSRGRFTRNVITGIEGNQGPYRLTGTNGETFIIVISGTEAVYLDGQKLTRGEQNDYVVDYNTGEITFMPKRVITQYSRIVVEFQFSDRNYARSVIHFNTAYEHKKYRLQFNYFTEQDNKNQPFLQNLTDSNKQVLAAVGDDLNAALAPSGTATNTFSNQKILYRKIDTIGYTGIFVHALSAGEDTVFYEVQFSQVGAGRGNYVFSQSAANGRVFQWVAPVGGVPQGDYEPVVQLIAPRRQQMLTMGAAYTPNELTTISVEGARSINDINLYSDLDKANDGGNAIKIAIENVLPISGDVQKGWNLKTSANYEYTQATFRYVERYRNVEFDRIWNRQLTNTQTKQDTGFEENIAYAKFSLQKLSIGNVFYQFGFYDRDKNFNGIQHAGGLNLQLGKYQLIGEAELTNTEDKTAGSISNTINRYRVDAGRNLGTVFAGVNLLSERSSFFNAGDSLIGGSFAYNQYGAYIRNVDDAKVTYRVEYNERNDFQPNSTEFSQSTKARTGSGNISLLQKNMNRLSASATYREFEIIDTNLIQATPERTTLARVEYDYKFLKRVFSANTYFQLGAGNELRRDFQYLEVPAGQGQYVWKDFDGNGTQTLNEFVLASAADRILANYIRVFLPTNSTIRVNTNQFNQTLTISPSVIWMNKNGIKRFLAKWSNQTGVKLDRKTDVLDPLAFVNPFLVNLPDSQMISNSSVIRNTLFFNRTDPTFGFDLTYSASRNKSFQTNGFDNRYRNEQGANVRWNFSSEWGIALSYNLGYRTYTSDFFAINNYAYGFNEIKPKLIWQASRQLRITALFSYFEGLTTEEYGNILGANTEWGGELRYSAAKNGVINAKYSFIAVDFNGDISSPLGYDMMQGFVIGENQVWNISFQQRLSGNIQLSINYDGRKSADQNAIHIGRMEARYIF
jgi:hypothetical protein